MAQEIFQSLFLSLSLSSFLSFSLLKQSGFIALSKYFRMNIPGDTQPPPKRDETKACTFACTQASEYMSKCCAEISNHHYHQVYFYFYFTKLVFHVTEICLVCVCVYVLFFYLLYINIICFMRVVYSCHQIYPTVHTHTHTHASI